MAPARLLIILKACCFISCECQISAIYIPQLPHVSEWLLIFARDEWEWPRGIKNKKTKRGRRRVGLSGGEVGVKGRKKKVGVIKAAGFGTVQREQFAQICKFCHYLLSHMPMESWGKQLK